MYRVILLSVLFSLSQFHYSFSLINSQKNDTVPCSARLLSRYIMHASVTGNERVAGLFFSTVARQKGLHVEVLTDEPASFNFTASLYPLEMLKPNIVFLNHIDVVPAGDIMEYTYPPFSGTIADGKVWGRGAIDNKGMGVMQLLAIECFVDLAGEIDLPFNITMLSVSGEETGGYTGAKIITGEYLEYLNPIAVYGEGGSGLPDVLLRDPERKIFGVSVAFKRSLWLEVTLRMNTSGHGAVPPANYAVKNKVQALNRLIEGGREVRFSETTRNMFYELGKLEGGLRGLALRNLCLFRPFVVPAMKREEIIYSLISNTATITAINTPEGPPNQIPQEITAVFDCRLLPEISSEEYVAKIKNTMDNKNIEISVIKEAVNAPPTEVDHYYYYMKDALEQVYSGSGVLPVLAPASNDNNYFRVHGIPTYGILPVFLPVYLLETIHNIDERLPIDALEKGFSVYRELIYKILESKYGDYKSHVKVK